MKITSKYLVVPINMQMTSKTVLLYDENGKLIFDFWANIDPLTPQFHAYLDVARFRGMDMTVVTEPAIDIEFEQVDERPRDGVRNDYLRPAVHFSADVGWLNDPNGLVKHNGIYHLFYQINPLQPTFGSMHWGHATSTDLIHWEDGDIALHPDDTGTMFSGSGFIDTKNASGLSENGDTMLLFYTAAAEHTATSRGKTFTQNLAYSKDGGKTITKYEKNPVVRNSGWGQRDPKVVWVDELDTYIMATYQADSSCVYRLYESKNLLDWIPFQDITIQQGVEECPDIYPLWADGVKKWVLSGANDTYLIGNFDTESRRLVFETKPKKLHYGNASFAGQTYANTPGRTIRVVCNVFRETGTKFNAQMGIPMEMSLEKQYGEYYLKAYPVPEFDAISGKTETYHGRTEMVLSKRAAYDITVKVPKGSAAFKIKMFNAELDVRPIENRMYYRDKWIPLSVSYDDVEVRIITDTFTVECYLDGGLVYAVYGGILDKSLNKLSINSDAAEVTVKELERIFN